VGGWVFNMLMVGGRAGAGPAGGGGAPPGLCNGWHPDVRRRETGLTVV
jgi:hypothetical protein